MFHLAPFRRRYWLTAANLPLLQTLGMTNEQLPLLLARWKQSLELHRRYAALDDEHYQHVQPWPKHERPARWIIDLAHQRLEALSRLVGQRTTEGDRVFVEALELMAFLATLVGLSGIERHIPLASMENERRDILNDRPVAARARKDEGSRTATREMPRPAAAASSRTVATRASAAPPPTKARASNTGKRPATRSHDALVVEDAVRLLSWGRQWHELTDLIGRLAERPPPAEIRRILREQRPRIEKAGAPR